MIVSTKIRLKPTKEQEVLFWKSCGVARWSYNYFLAESENHYAEYLKGNKEKKTVKEGDVRKYINNVLKKTTHTWLGEVGSNVMKQAVKDADLARKRWFQGVSERPRFKSKHKSKNSFYVNYESLKRVQNGFQGEKIGFVKTCQPLPKLKEGQKYSNPRLSFDGKNWFISVGYDKAFDSGVLIYKTPLKEMKNIQKQNKVIRNLHKRLNDIRSNHLHQSTSEIVKTKPYRIVMETLNIKGMMKNSHLSKTIAQQCLYEFKRQIQYKCNKYGIAFVEADKWFPSSKTCSCCGVIKKDLRLSDRVFKCQCGFTLDRDLNASINLANY